MPKIQKYDLKNAVFTDINPCYKVNSLPFLLPDEQSVVECSLYALFNCPIGDRGGIFEPEYGSYLPWFLQEPIDQVTANRIKMSLHQTLARWEPRIVVNYNDIDVVPHPEMPGYALTVSIYYKITKQKLIQSYLIYS